MIKYYLLFFTLMHATLSFAGGPLILAGENGNTPVTYQNPTVTVHVETGLLGTLSNVQAQTLMNDGFNLWNNIDTTTVNLIVNQTLLSTDINGTNFETYLPTVDNSNFNANDNLNPIVFDSDGKIIDAYFGNGQSETIIGFAESIFTQNDAHFIEGYLVINGKNAEFRTNEEITLLFAHEIGHFMGLDHSQTNINNQESDATFLPTLCTTSNQENYPVMYPYECRKTNTLHPDDISAMTELYPATNVTNNFGIIEGYFVDGNNTPILGANIWAENIITGDAYSIISDYLLQNNGYYKLLLPAGNYTLHANSVNTVFFSSSSVGPHATEIDDISFTSPHPITTITLQDSTVVSDATITVAVNEIKEINFSSNGEAVDFASIIFQNEKSSGGSISLVSLLLIMFLLFLRNNISKIINLYKNFSSYLKYSF